MQFNQFIENTSDVALLTGLEDFGLHPMDWMLIPKDEHQFVIQHKNDSDFYFIGKVCAKNTFCWEQLSLASFGV